MNDETDFLRQKLREARDENAELKIVNAGLRRSLCGTRTTFDPKFMDSKPAVTWILPADHWRRETESSGV